MHTSDSMEVVLSSELWPDMICEKPDEENIHISMLDEGEVEIFLITCSIKEAETLYTTLEYRIDLLKTSMAGDSNEEQVVGVQQVLEQKGISQTHKDEGVYETVNQEED